MDQIYKESKVISNKRFWAIFILLMLIFIIYLIFYSPKSTEKLFNDLLKKKDENFADDVEIQIPQAVAIINRGRIVNVKLIKDTNYVSPSFFHLYLDDRIQTPGQETGKIRWNDDKTFTILNPGKGYLIPPEIVFIPKTQSTPQVGTKNSKGKKTKPTDKKGQSISTPIYVKPSGMWDDIPKNEKDILADLTQDYLREQKYSESLLENVFLSGIVSKQNEKTFSIEWQYPIEFNSIILYYNQLDKNVKLIQLRGYNENNVELFYKELMYKSIVEWKYTALLKKIVIQGATQWSNCEVYGRRVYWTCDEYADFVEQLKESRDKPGKSSSKYEDDDTTILYSEVLSQIPSDFQGKTKQTYIDYYSTMENHCSRKNKEQMDAEKLIEDQEIDNYKKLIEAEQEKASKYKEKLMRDYNRMVKQYDIDVQNQKDAAKYGIPAPEFQYSQQEISDLKKRIESIKNIPEDKLLRDCAKLEKTYNKQRKNAEKWAKAGIFLPFLKKKAKRESKKAEKSENKYQTNCAELVALSYSY